MPFVQRAPRTLTDQEVARILKVTGEHRDGFRDHVILSLALGTGLREHEIAALNVGDVFQEGRVKRRVTLKVFKRSSKDPSGQEVFLPDALWYKITKFITWKERNQESLDLEAPLFVTRLGTRPSTRALRYMFAHWQEKANLDKKFNFHALRHTALTNVYKSTKDILIAQRVARHKNVATTAIYTAPSDDDIFRNIKDLTC